MRTACKRERETSSISHFRPLGPAGFHATSTRSAISRRMLAVEYRSATAACATVIPRGTLSPSCSFFASTPHIISHPHHLVRFTGAFFCKKKGHKKAHIACARMRNAYNACGEMTRGGGGDKVATYTGARAAIIMPPQYATARSGMHCKF